MMMFNPFTGQMMDVPNNQLDTIDILSVISFYIGLKNYQENLSQSDKDDLMQKLDAQTGEILQRLTTEIEKQNVMLEKILNILQNVDI